jgi:alkylation response protein AidB-like acyl-CoA dehydrogenase
MDFTLTEPERDLLDLGRGYAEREIAAVAPRAWREERCPTEVLRGLGELGLLGPLVPEKWGGIGASTVGFVALLEALAAVDPSVAAAWQAHATIGSLPLLLFGSDEQRERFLQFLSALEVGRISVAALSVGTALGALRLAQDYALRRRQFGAAIASFQAIGFKLADMATEIEAARWLTYYAASLRDSGGPFKKEAAMAKLKASRVATFVTSEAVQILGGAGYMLESPVARFYCDAKVLEIGEGTNEIQHLVIARELGC